ncbi:50S ribosomal protein L6 [Oleomonas cavernae]|uniref:Large ribosomal subunit protein uL6 n=1 Tax=Oleomonas cavernae TaxID=2320859 RepID=A0A418WEF3_9PROT|nr:50S ribosomal protein L6 [Oleomonas cavernae]RJF88382.1 50S ribosomal protein L6 [Oleomonas cavernae]
MSRIGKKAVSVPSGVNVTVDGQDVAVKGTKGQLALRVVEDIVVKFEDGHISLKPREDTKRARMMWGMSRTLVSNMVKGVTEGFKVNLEINGVGYRAAVQGRNLNLNLGYSHDVVFPIPDGIDIKCEKPTLIAISGIDAQQVGQVAAEIREWRRPEPYKGKGIKYSTETIFRKEGKKK